MIVTSDEPEPARRARQLWRFRLGVCSLVLGAIAFVQTPGQIVTDSKLDLTVDPGGLLARALQLWDPLGAFGQVQNQAYGYLFPMGPFFWSGDLLGLPPWVIQRMWWTVVLVTAFLGFIKLCSVLNIGVPWVRILGGFAFALSPRFLSVIGPSSVELWPSAVAPWVLIPLVIGLRRNDPRRMAALSAVAVSCVGGVNAAAAFAVIPLGVLLLLLAPASPRRFSLIAWWPGLVVLATAWWLVPLFLLGRYSPPFLDYIESAANTTIATDLFNTLRGTTNWLPYIDTFSNAGNQLLTQPALIANGVVVVAFGLIGLARRDLPFGGFLLSGVFVGVAMVAMGHRGAIEGLGAGSVQHALDGVLAPLRNTHKFDVVLRIPLVLAFVHGVSIFVRNVRSSVAGSATASTTKGIGVMALATIAVLGATVPAWTGALANRGSFTEVPDYWEETADWLGEYPNGTALLAPASAFGDYSWGKTGDEPMQPLASSPWAVRNLIPLAPGGNIEMLDAISRRFATGQGSEGFASFLRRAGIGYVVVRNDLNRNQDIVDPALVYATLEGTPGVRSVMSFGPTVGGGPTLTREDGSAVFVDHGRQTQRPAVEIFEVGGAAVGRAVQDRATTPVLVGSAESLLSLDDVGTTSKGSVIFAQDADKAERPERLIVSDGLRRQEAAFGSINHARSGSLTPGESYSSNRPVHRYDQEAVSPWIAEPVLDGAERLSASSSQSDVGALPRIDQSAQPWSAFDRDIETTWKADFSDAGDTSWIELGFENRQLVGTASILLGLPPGQERRLTITTERGNRTVNATAGTPITVDVGRVSRVRISGASTADEPLAISDVTFSALNLNRPLRLPTLPSAWGSPDQILLESGSGYNDGCLSYDGLMRCSDDAYSAGDSGRSLDRIVPLQAPAAFRADLLVAPRGGAALTALVQTSQLSTVAASSQVVPSPEASAVRAIDGRSSTGWIADVDDPDPTVNLSWLGQRKISALNISTDSRLAATAPTKVLLRFPDGTSQQVPVRRGVARFEPVKTASVEVHLLGGPRRFTVGYRGGVSELPVGVSEISIRDSELFPTVLPTGPLPDRCGSGPDIAVDGEVYPTAVRTTVQDVLSGELVPARICDDKSLTLDAGEHRITVTGNGAFRAAKLTLTAGMPVAPPARRIPSDGDRSTVPPSPSGDEQLVIDVHNQNSGWEARVDGDTVRPVVANGWQQAWEVGPKGGTLEEKFAPEPLYRAALVVGAVLAGMVVLLALGSGRATASALRSTNHLRRRNAGWVSVCGGLAVLTFVSGGAGLAAAVLGVFATAVARVRWDRAAQVLAPIAVVVASAYFVVEPWGGTSGWAGLRATPSLLVAFALGVLLEPLRGNRAFFWRRSGFSTS